MRILYLGNNRVGWQVLKWLKEQGEDIVGLVLHPANKQKFVTEILDAASLPPGQVFDGSQLKTEKTLKLIKDLKTDIALSVLFDYVLQERFISLFPHGVINLHPAYLPYNRGQYPNVWSIIEGTPAGVTMHYIDKGVDTGDIIAQKRVTAEPVDTGKTLYRKLERASLALFKEIWPFIKTGKAPRVPQSGETGTYHRTRDVEKIDEINPGADYSAGDLVNILRARTFPPYKGAYIMKDGKKIYLSLKLSYDKPDKQ